MKNNIHKKLIDDFFTESKNIALSKNISPIIDTASSDLVEKFIEQPDPSLLNSWYQEKISNYIDSLLPPEEKTYHGQLSLLFHDLAFSQKDENITSTYAIAEKIFVNYASELSFEDATKVLLVLVENDLFNHNYEDAMITLQWLYSTHPLLKAKAKKDFNFYIAQCFFHFGIQDNNREYLYKAITHSRHLLSNKDINKEELNVTLYIIIKSFEILKLYKESMLAIDEYFRNFPEFDMENQLFPEILYIKWCIYEHNNQYKKALSLFKQYKKLFPVEADTIDKKIRLLLSNLNKDTKEE